MLVVVVDDNENSQNFAAKILKQYLIDVIAFCNSIEALNYLILHQPDVVLIDFVLPGGPNGLKLAAQVRRLYPACIIVMISAFAQMEHVIEAMRIGCDDFLLKSNLRPEELLDRVNSAVMQRKSWFPAPNQTRVVESGLELDIEARTAIWFGKKLTLSPTQFNLLATLASKPGHIFGYSELYALNTGIRLSPSAARSKLKTHVTNLRNKLELDGYPRMIWNIRGAGFKWELSDESVEDDDI